MKLCPACGRMVENGRACRCGKVRLGRNGGLTGSRVVTDRRRALEAVWGSARWARLRKRILERDGWRCVRCGSERRLTCDHKYGFDGPDDPRAWDETNLQTLCASCSGRKDGRRRYARPRPTTDRRT